METTARHGVSVGGVVRTEGELGVGRPLVAVLTSQHGAAQTEPNYPGPHDLRQVSLESRHLLRNPGPQFVLVLELINY